MDDKKKIVIATEDIIAKGLDDIFININLQQKFNVIKREKFDNNFDLAEQFRKERNASRSFRVYGIIDSPIIDCDNLTIKVYSKTDIAFGFQVVSSNDLIATITSQPLGYGDKNVFGKQRGKYILELNNYKISDTVYLVIEGDGTTYARTIIEQQLVFKGADGEFVEYGTNTVDIGLNGEFVTINNDFPFFYNKHWIKTNFQIEKVQIRNVKFGSSKYSFNEGEEGVITVELSEPSVFGTENVTVILTSPTIEDYDTAIPGLDFDVDTFPFSFPITLGWGIGEQVREIDISALNDSNIEKTNEKFSLSLISPLNVTTDQGVVNIQNTSVDIVDQNPKVYVNYNFQKIIKNINPITDPNIFPENLGVIPGYEMNIYGAKDGVGPLTEVNNNYRFFPNDTLELTIINEGDSTILPIIPGHTTQEQFFGAGQSITLQIVTKYQNHDSLPKEVAVFDFKEKDIGIGGLGSVYYSNEFYINGLEFNYGPLVADEFVEKIEQRYLQVGMELPFTISQQFATVTLTAKHPATNINGFIPQEDVSIGTGDYAMFGLGETPDYPNGRVDSITEQIPLELKLYANTGNATNCNYSFTISKTGYKPVQIAPSILNATASGNDVYLVTPIKDVSGPSLPVGDPSVCNPFTNTVDTDGYYLNGVALLASSLFDSEEATATNEHTSGYLPSFRQSPLVSDVITCNNLIGISKVLS